MGKCVYVDESGDESLQLVLPNISSFYVVCALVVDPQHADAVTQRFNEVRARYFKNREMKSSRVDDVRQRLQILQELAGVEFALHILIGNKSLLTQSGLRYPKSFIKYLHAFLYKEIIKDHPGICVRADRIKNRSFMHNMARYLDRHNLIGLFEMNSFEFIDSEADVCIQAADFIGGSVRACFERSPRGAMTDPIIEKLRYRIVQVLPFPESYGRYIGKLAGVGEHDQAIEARAILEAEQFLSLHAGSDEMDDLLQVAVVRRLLFAHALRDDSWISTEDLIDHLNGIAPEPLSEQSFRSIIGRLRDAHVLIASRRTWGYKLATSTDDITEFLNRQNSQLAPMIERVRIARQTVSRATDNAVDILAAPEFESLKAAVTATPPWYESALASPEGELPDSARPLTEPAFNVPPSNIVHEFATVRADDTNNAVWSGMD